MRFSSHARDLSPDPFPLLKWRAGLTAVKREKFAKVKQSTLKLRL